MPHEEITEAGAPGGFLNKILPEGSTRAGVFNLASATLGAGALTLPYAFRQSGLALALFWLTLGMLCTVYSIHLLVLVMQTVKKSPAWTGPRNLETYEELSHWLFSKRIEHIVEAQIIIFCYGSSIAYIIAVGDILDPIRKLHGMPSILQDHYGRQLVMLVFFTFMMLPLSLLKNVNALRFSSLLGVVSILILVSATIYHCVTHRLEDWHWEKKEIADGSFSTSGSGWTPESIDDPKVSWAVLASNAILPVPLILLAYTCQVNVFSIYQELKNPTPKKMMTISWIGMGGICFFVYGCMGTFGYLDFLSHTDSTILKNFDPAKDPFVAVAFVAIAITVVVAFPLCTFPCRDAVFQVILSCRAGGREEQQSLTNSTDNSAKAIKEKDVSTHSGASSHGSYMWGHKSQLSMRNKTLVKPSNAMHYGLSFVISFSALLFALVIPTMSIVFSYLGAVCSSYLCLTLPAAFVKKMKKIEKEYFDNKKNDPEANAEIDAKNKGLKDLWTEPGIPDTLLSNVGVEILYWGGYIAGLASVAVTAYNQVHGD